MSDAAVDGNVTRSAYLEYIERAKETDEGVAAALRERRALMLEVKEAGFDTDAFRRARKEADKSGELRERQHREFIRNMAWLGKPVGYNGAAEPNGAATNGAAEDLDPPVNEMQRQVVEEQGYEAGHSGRPRDDNPWTPTTLLAGDWDEAWDRGNADRIAEQGDEPERRGPGRPKGSRNRTAH